MSSLMWWNSWSSLHTYLVYGHISKSSVKAVHVKLPHKLVRDEKSRVNLFRLPRTSLLWSHTSSMWTTGLLRAYCPVLATSLVDLLDAGDGEGDDQVDHEEHDDNYEFRWKWWVMSKWLYWTLQNHLVSPNCSVASTACSGIHSRIHSTYHVLSGLISEEHKSLAWSCVIIETKAGSSTGSQAAEELVWESHIK